MVILSYSVILSPSIYLTVVAYMDRVFIGI